MPRSLRWTLAAWYGLALLVVIVVFGATLYARTARALFAQVDDGLSHRAAALAGALERDVFTPTGWELELDDEYLALLVESGWFEIRAADGKLIRSGGAVPGPLATAEVGFHDRADARELVVVGERAARVRVGRSVSPERDELRRIAWFTGCAGFLVLAIAGAGGWWFATRALRPIARMSEAAASISEKDLSRRMDERAVPEELRELTTTLNAAFERIEAAFTRQTQFTADAAHELRTPLAIVRAQAELALRRERTGLEYREALAACLRSAERMSRVVNALLALARADSGALATARVAVRFDEVVEECVREARTESASVGVSLFARTEPALVHGDPSLLAELAANLVSNAIRYNRPGGRVDVALARRDGNVVLSVEDDGIGIPADARAHVFERFFRVDPARSRASGGSGLGLAIARAIVEAHGGWIGVESRVDSGSTFTVVLTASAEPDEGPGVLLQEPRA